jgi:hypothetical protein
MGEWQERLEGWGRTIGRKDGWVPVEAGGLGQDHRQEGWVDGRRGWRVGAGP